MSKNVVIILAGGKGERFGYEKPKQFAKIAGKTIIEHTINVFEEHPLIHEIYIVIHPQYYDLMLELIKKNQFKKVKKVLYGGETRQESSRIGVYALENDVEKVLIHDSVRPFIKNSIITSIIEALNNYRAVDVAISTSDTIIKVNDKNFILEIPERKYLKRGQTPQGFKKDIIHRAHKLAQEEGFDSATDDCSLVMRYNLCEVYVVEGDQLNIKVTYPNDVYIADRIFQLKKLSALEMMDSYVIEKSFKILKNKVVVVFGGTSGIGKEIFDIGRKYGADVYSYSRRTGVDVREYSTIEKALQEVYEKHDKIDIIINSSGVLKMTPIINASLEDIKEQIEVNLLGSFYVAKASISYLKETKGSLILFTSSSYTRGREFYSPYSASKAGVVNLVQALSDELCEYGIKVNAICPERTATPMRFKNFGKEPDETLLDPKAVAYTTLLVALNDITGQIIDVRKSREEVFIKLTGLL